MNQLKLMSLERIIGELHSMAAAEAATYEPVAFLEVVDIGRDLYSVSFWKNGFPHGDPEGMKCTSWEAATDFIMELPEETLVQFDFGNCSEYLVCFHFRRQGIVSPEGEWLRDPFEGEAGQRCKEAYLKDCPWCECLWNGDAEGDALRRLLCLIPERLNVTVGDFRNFIWEEADD